MSTENKSALPKFTPEGIHLGEILIPSNILLEPGGIITTNPGHITTMTVTIAVDSARYTDSCGIYFNPYNAAQNKADAYEAGWRARQEYEALNKHRASFDKDPLPKPPNPYL